MRHFLFPAALAIGVTLTAGCTPSPAAHAPSSPNKLQAQPHPTASASTVPLANIQTPSNVSASVGAMHEADGPQPDLVIGNPAFEAVADAESIVYTFESAILVGDRSPRITVVDPTSGTTLRALVSSDQTKTAGSNDEVDQITPFLNGFLSTSKTGQLTLRRFGTSGMSVADSTVLNMDVGDGGDLVVHAISPTGDQLWAGGRPNEILIWDTKAKTSVSAFDSKTPQSEVPAAFKYLPNGTQVVGYGWNDGLTVYNSATGKVVYRSDEVSGQLGVFHQVAIVESGFLALNAKHTDKPTCVLRLFKLDSAGRLLASVTLRPGRINAYQLLPDGSGVAVAQGNKVLVFNANDGKERLSVQPFVGSDSDVRKLVISPNGRQALVTGTLGVNTVDLTTGALHHAPTPNPLLAVQSVAFGPDGLLAYSDGKKLVVTSLSKKSTLFQWGINASRKIVFSADGKSLIGLGETLFRADLTTGKIIWEVGGKPSYTFTNTFVITPDLSKVVHGGYDRTLHVLDGKTGRTQHNWETKCNEIYHLLLKGNAVGCRNDKELVFHDLTSGARVATLPLQNLQVETSNQTLGVGYLYQNKTALLFDLATGKKKADLPMGEKFAVEPGGSWVAGYHFYTGKITLTDLTTGKEHSILRPGSFVRALAASPNGDQLAVARNGFVEVWNVRQLLRGAP
ncbi:MAG: WD40 repeat domain-containing protein [Polyangiaceae bacterium]|nr:WD40 repeat domain-containing protein [Polyangiaceae bacterium]